MLFIFAWNEWGEGGYLEPDEQIGYEMLQAISNALEADDAFVEVVSIIFELLGNMSDEGFIYWT